MAQKIFGLPFKLSPKIMALLVLRELEAYIGKTFQGEAIVNYASAWITQHMKASGSPKGQK